MTFYTPAEEGADPLRPIEAVAGLPNVLLIGDSISIGYTLPVRRRLAGTCNVHRPATNCGDTANGLAHLDDWLGDRNWDLIHFNWGLHDLCYRHPDATHVYGNRDKINGTQAIAPQVYQTNLAKLVDRMIPAARRLVWATTTYIPAGEAGRFQRDEVRYNTLAESVMAERGVATNDLFALTRSFEPELFEAPGDVHYTLAGKEKVGEAVAACIADHLAAT